ncbi:uncharacterized protein rab11fip1a [Astyanax mexicanus]|uniref:uncharacterized protein rab11fip1a n=1 Tax=Astyanax mexicanus TaxID=7994 RepID=UPI0020CAB387|nr:uncharacterized protein rab11fip1a [Astyanax mexicanus]
MSLAEQSQQWYPTSAQVTVLEARNLRLKGKNGTNDAYAIMQVAKDKFSTSVAEKSVAPVWKEEATFDLPLFHQGNAERCTLYIIIMHRALVGLDKLLGQAVINLVELQENKARKRTDWYKLVDKNGKADKERGEVLLDIQFMRNNMTASMFDLSMQDKPRSRISKLKDKVRGKKKEGLSDSASAIVPSTVSQVLTDSEGEGEANVDSPKSKKSSKLKSLFAPKSNLHRGVSQSMSTLGTLPEKNSPLSSSRSSGLNVESPEVKNKFKFLGHKRTGSNDSKVSLGPFSLLNRSKQNIPEQSLCINGSHVYAEDQEPKPTSGSSLSLSSSAKGSVEDLRKYHERNASDVSADSFKGLSIPTYKPEPVEKPLPIQQHPQEDEEKKHKKEGRLQEVLERQEEQERKRQQEREEKLRKQEEEEQKRRLKQEERERQEAEERQRKKREEEAKKAEEQKRQEESRVAERLTTLFGLGKKKEEPSPPAVENPKHLEEPASLNPFEEIPLSPDTTNPFLEQSPAASQKEVRSTFTPTPPANVFPGRTAKVSAVKPRLVLSPKPDTDNINPLASPVTSDIQTTSPASILSPKQSDFSNPFESGDMSFSDYHSSVAPPKPQRTFTDSPRGSMENLSSAEYSANMSGKKQRAPQPPSYHGDSSQNGSASTNSAGQRPSIPLPDYEVLFPKKRHGVMTSTRWEHIIAEVNQRKMDSRLPHIGEEMSVDGPSEPVANKSPGVKEDSLSSLSQHRKNHLEKSSAPTVKVEPKQALIPPKQVQPKPSKQVLEVNSEQVHTTKPEPVYATVDRSSRSAARVLDSESRPEPLYTSVDKSRRLSAKALESNSRPESMYTPVDKTNRFAAKALEGNSRPEPAYATVNKTNRFAAKALDSDSRPEPVYATVDKTNRFAAKVLESKSKSEPAYSTVDKSSRFVAKALESDSRPEPVYTTVDKSSRFVAKALESDSRPEPVYTTVDKSSHFAAKVLDSDSGQRVQSLRESQVNKKTTVDSALDSVVRTSETKEKPTPVVRAGKRSNSPDIPITFDDNVELPSAKPRQRAPSKEPVRQVQPEQPTALSLSSSEHSQETRKRNSMAGKSLWESTGSEERAEAIVHASDVPDTGKTVEMPKEHSVADVSKDTEKVLLDSDPFPNDKLIPQDPWALPQQNMDMDDLFTGGPKNVKKSNDLGLTAEDFDNVFGSTASKNKTDPFAAASKDQGNAFFGSDPSKDAKDPFSGSVSSKDQDNAFFGSGSSKDANDPFSESVAPKDQANPFFASDSSKDLSHSQSGSVASKTDKTGSDGSSNSSLLIQKGYSLKKRQAPRPPVNSEKTVSQKPALDNPVPQFAQDAEDVELTVTSVAEPHYGKTTIATSKADLWGMDPFTSPSQALSSSATPEPGSGGKSALCAWVSPSESGGSGALSSRRPHPVKPLSSTESQSPSSISVVKDLKTTTIREVAEKSKPVESGPYTQLTQGELITLVVKQQTELSKKDAKILELEDYIDNLLVRVIEEKPSILLALNTKA